MWCSMSMLNDYRMLCVVNGYSGQKQLPWQLTDSTVEVLVISNFLPFGMESLIGDYNSGCCDLESTARWKLLVKESNVFYLASW